MKKHAIIKIKSLHQIGVNQYSLIGDKLHKMNREITVKKDGPNLKWKSGDMSIPPSWIEEVLEGNIDEYLL